jgi:thiol-disulfide isomerase/thioredoxin
MTHTVERNETTGQKNGKNTGQHTPRRMRNVTKFVLGPIAAVAVLAAIYGTIRPPSNAISNVPGETAHPKVSAAFVRKPSTDPLPSVAFQNASGQAVNLENFRGRVVLLNLWATWCLPCRKEMPALDRLQAALGSPDFEVVALSIDRAGSAASKKFLDSTGATNLALYVDPTAKLATDFKAIGLPATILIGRDGREIGRLLGPAAWDAPDAQALIKNAIAGK